MIRKLQVIALIGLAVAGAFAVSGATKKNSPEAVVEAAVPQFPIVYDDKFNVGTLPGGVIKFGGGDPTPVPKGFEIATFGAG